MEIQKKRHVYLWKEWILNDAPWFKGKKKKNQNFLKLVETVPDLYLNQN